MDAVCVQDKHVGVTGDRIGTDHTAVIELHLQPKHLQGNLNKDTIVPLLITKVRQGELAGK